MLMHEHKQVSFENVMRLYSYHLIINKLQANQQWSICRLSTSGKVATCYRYSLKIL